MAREPNSLKRIIDLCDGCTMPDIMTGLCTAFVDPGWQWRNYDPATGEGRCWGRCETAQEMVERLSPFAAASADSARRRELREWQARYGREG